MEKELNVSEMRAALEAVLPLLDGSALNNHLAIDFPALAKQVKKALGKSNTTNSVFDVFSLDRNKVHWEDYIYHLTPVEFVRNGDGKACFFKREDYFAPLGFHGINGSKLRQAIYLFTTEAAGKSKVINGTSVKSPQIPMASACARHFGKDITCVLGATKPETAPKHEMVDMALFFGCNFKYINIGYNHNLQLKCQEILAQDPENTFYLEYGITLNHNQHSPKSVYDFHKVGAEQVKNIPDTVEDLIIPAGSCNSAASVLLGFMLYGWKNLKRIHLVGTGPSKIKYLTERLEIMGEYCKKDFEIFGGLPYTFPVLRKEIPLQTFFYDLHGTKYVTYQDEMPFTFGGIDLHPTYEGKVMTYIYEKVPELIKDTTLFWIVGNKPYKQEMVDYVF